MFIKSLNVNVDISRRQWFKMIAGTLPLLLRPQRAFAVGDRSKLTLAVLQLSERVMGPRRAALKQLAWEIDKRTSIDARFDAPMVSTKQPELFDHPLLFLFGDNEFPLPDAESLERLRRYLAYGGTLVIDSSDIRAENSFDHSVRALLNAVAPEKRLKPVEPTHVIFKSFYLLDHVVGRSATIPYLEALEDRGRLSVVYCRNDWLGAWAKDDLGAWSFAVTPGGDTQREMAVRWGINVVMYVLCTDYKSDQVHVPFLLKRRRWRAQ